MARYAQAPVLLVGDIDRGGLYASLLGTMEVLADWERALVRGFIINRFRGKKALLTEANDFIQGRTGRPVLGVVPYLERLGLPEEDSLALKNGTYQEAAEKNHAIEITVVDLPHISNFTDFDPLRLEPDVRLRFVRSPKEVERTDVLILPGSKNVLADLAALRELGWGPKIKVLAGSGAAEIIGICGGFQLLGRKISDPEGIESPTAQQAEGLGLLPIETTLQREKTLRATVARHQPSGLEVAGYQIHHGQTKSKGGHPVMINQEGEILGVAMPGKQIWGTYLHGLFDADKFRRWFIDRLRLRREMLPLHKIQVSYDLQPAFDRLAEAVRQSLDLGAIYQAMGL
jgi:cobyric acid synthase CobQ